jgi:hypothetical protein
MLIIRLITIAKVLNLTLILTFMTALCMAKYKNGGVDSESVWYINLTLCVLLQKSPKHNTSEVDSYPTYRKVVFSTETHDAKHSSTTSNRT